MVVMSAVFALLAIFVCLLFAAALFRSHRKLRRTKVARPTRAGASWQVGRWDTDARHAYVANVGNDTAYEVTVTSPHSDRVIRTVELVPPYNATRLESTSDPPCYVSFSLDNRARQPQHAGAGSSAAEPEMHEIVVRLRWRSEQGHWSTQVVRID
jgi:hypothetical protein